MLANLLIKTGIVAAQSVLTSAAVYCTNNAIEMYASPDLRDCKTDEERIEKIEKFEKKKTTISNVIGVVEAGILSAGSAIAMSAIDTASIAKTTADSQNQKDNNESSLVNARI